MLPVCHIRRAGSLPAGGGTAERAPVSLFTLPPDSEEAEVQSNFGSASLLPAASFACFLEARWSSSEPQDFGHPSLSAARQQRQRVQDQEQRHENPPSSVQPGSNLSRLASCQHFSCLHLFRACCLRRARQQRQGGSSERGRQKNHVPSEADTVVVYTAGCFSCIGRSFLHWS
jgi:hypothetical protein